MIPLYYYMYSMHNILMLIYPKWAFFVWEVILIFNIFVDVEDEPPRTVVEAIINGEKEVFMTVSANFGPEIDEEFGMSSFNY